MQTHANPVLILFCYVSTSSFSPIKKEERNREKMCMPPSSVQCKNAFESPLNTLHPYSIFISFNKTAEARNENSKQKKCIHSVHKYREGNVNIKIDGRGGQQQQQEHRPMCVGVT